MNTQSPLAVESWIADRTKNFDSSGIRRMFDLAGKLKDPVNLSIGQPDFDVPQPVKDELIQAIVDGKNGYAPTQGIPLLREKLQAEIDREYNDENRKVFVCSGTSGGLFLSILSLVNAGDEVIFFDPYFVMYPALVELASGRAIKISTYPTFDIDFNRLEDTITDRTKVIILNSPSNPTGVCYSDEQIRAVAELAHRKGICLVSDEIYSKFTYDHTPVSPAKYNPNTVVIDGFSKSFAMTGLRVGYVHGPSDLIDTMMKLQQFTFVCAPQPCQWACAVAMDTDISHHVDDYRKKRDLMVEGLKDKYEFATPNGAFYLFPKLPWGTGEEFVLEAIDNNLMVIPGNIFSDQDTHFRISYAVTEEKIQAGIEILNRLADRQ